LDFTKKEQKKTPALHPKASLFYFAQVAGGRHLLPKPCKIWDLTIFATWMWALPHGKPPACSSLKTINAERFNNLLQWKFRKI
tara:strand:- start:1291 stop:1539 length:249 start_codon:yes stop_codon:yes gene_type:complete